MKAGEFRATGRAINTMRDLLDVHAPTWTIPSAVYVIIDVMEDQLARGLPPQFEVPARVHPSGKPYMLTLPATMFESVDR